MPIEAFTTETYEGINAKKDEIAVGDAKKWYDSFEPQRQETYHRFLQSKVKQWYGKEPRSSAAEDLQPAEVKESPINGIKESPLGGNMASQTNGVDHLPFDGVPEEPHVVAFDEPQAIAVS